MYVLPPIKCAYHEKPNSPSYHGMSTALRYVQDPIHSRVLRMEHINIGVCAFIPSIHSSVPKETRSLLSSLPSVIGINRLAMSIGPGRGRSNANRRTLLLMGDTLIVVPSPSPSPLPTDVSASGSVHWGVRYCSLVVARGLQEIDLRRVCSESFTYISVCERESAAPIHPARTGLL